jgi:hypothetical protein
VFAWPYLGLGKARANVLLTHRLVEFSCVCLTISRVRLGKSKVLLSHWLVEFCCVCLTISRVSLRLG